MMTRDLEPVPMDYGSDSWLGADPEAALARPELARGAGAYVHPGSALAEPTGLGMDPTDPATYSRPYNPQQGMFARLHHDQARKAQAR